MQELFNDSSCSLDTMITIRYTSSLMKKLMVSLLVLAFFVLPGKALAEEQTICTQTYGGGVVCGVHTPVETGIADSIPLIASGFLGASGVLAYFSNKSKKQN